MNKILTCEELKEVFGELIVKDKNYEIKVKDGYLISATDPITKEVKNITIFKKDTVYNEIIASKKFRLMRILKGK